MRSVKALPDNEGLMRLSDAAKMKLVKNVDEIIGKANAYAAEQGGQE